MDSSEDIIENKIANSGLINLSIEDYYPKGVRRSLDIAPWLYEGMILREKDFRQYVKEHDWEQYADAFVNVFCSADAIIPQWAYMLLAVSLKPYATKVIFGSSEELESILMEESISKTDFSAFEDKRVIIKGCGDLPIPPNAFLQLTSAILPFAKSIMYGEACSTVPIFKRKR